MLSAPGCSVHGAHQCHSKNKGQVEGQAADTLAGGDGERGDGNPKLAGQAQGRGAAERLPKLYFWLSRKGMCESGREEG